MVHADETSWSLNSVWAFLSEKARVLLFGVHKDAETLEKILDPATFAGIVISDHAAVYDNFSAAQKCWAHLLRKAIKLSLQDPSNEDYRNFTDRLLEIYREACRVQGDGRLSDAGRAHKVALLEDELFELCSAKHFSPQDGPHQQDPRRRPPPNDLDQCLGILASVPADVYVRERYGRAESLVGKWTKLLRGAAAETQAAGASIGTADP